MRAIYEFDVPYSCQACVMCYGSGADDDTVCIIGREEGCTLPGVLLSEYDFDMANERAPFCPLKIVPSVIAAAIVEQGGNA